MKRLQSSILDGRAFLAGWELGLGFADLLDLRWNGPVYSNLEASCLELDTGTRHRCSGNRFIYSLRGGW
jgi:hypothetical protein